MGNWIDVRLDVLAPSPDEINKIEAALQQPCEDLLAWVAERWGKDQNEIATDATNLVAFRPIQNLGYMDSSVNKARRFQHSFKERSWGVVWSHVYCVSRDFPEAIFLAEHWDCQGNYTAKDVIRGGREIRHVSDNDQQAQCREWVLPNIFCPYRTEYELDVEFGMFWNPWLLAMEGAVAKLKERYGTPKAGTTCDSALLEWERKFEQAAEFTEHEEGNVNEEIHVDNKARKNYGV